VKLDARLVPGCTATDACAEIRALGGPDVEHELERSDATAPTDPDLGLWDVLAGALRDRDPRARSRRSQRWPRGGAAQCY
jgi:hypothetical protein